MGRYGEDDFFDEFVAFAAGLAPNGAAAPGELIAAARAVTPGDDESFHDAFRALGDRLDAAAEASWTAGHRVSARETWLRACMAHGLAIRTLYGVPRHPRLAETFARKEQSFERAAALMDPPGEAFGVLLDGIELPAWRFRAPVGGPGPRRVLVATNGYDATLHDLYFAHAVPALRRGWDCVVFDGPGQGRPLFVDGAHLRPDWEVVVGAVVDRVLDLPDVDPSRIALVGWSLGGYLALRAATGEHRLAALVVDPALVGLDVPLRAMVYPALSPEAQARYPNVTDDDVAPLAAFLSADRRRHWTLYRRAFQVHGITSFAQYVAVSDTFTTAGLLDRITCPVLVTRAEDDPLAATAEAAAAAVTAPCTLVRFGTDEGAGEHCEASNRPLYEQRVFDWLDETVP